MTMEEVLDAVRLVHVTLSWQTQHDHMLIKCWASVLVGGPTPNQRLVRVSRLPGLLYPILGRVNLDPDQKNSNKKCCITIHKVHATSCNTVGSRCSHEVECSASDNKGSNLVSGKQCHLIHLTSINVLPV